MAEQQAKRQRCMLPQQEIERKLVEMLPQLHDFQIPSLEGELHSAPLNSFPEYHRSRGSLEAVHMPATDLLLKRKDVEKALGMQLGAHLSRFTCSSIVPEGVGEEAHLKAALDIAVKGAFPSCTPIAAEEDLRFAAKCALSRSKRSKTTREFDNALQRLDKKCRPMTQFLRTFIPK